MCPKDVIKADVIDRYEKFVSFIIEDLPEGQRVIRVFPYYLEITKQYGLLLDFSFRKKPFVPFSKKIQQLSFSIDRTGKSNANSYLDRLNYISAFVQNTLLPLGTIPIGDQQHQISAHFTSLDSQELSGRTTTSLVTVMRTMTKFEESRHSLTHYAKGTIVCLCI